MNKLRAILTVAIAGLAMASAAAQQTTAQGRITVKVEVGRDWSHTKWFGIAPVKLRPQVAVWIETADGSFIDTIFVTHRAAYGDWKAAGGARRPESLPLWSHARGVAGADGLFMPDATHPLPDAVSGATPAAGFTCSWAVPAGLSPGLYRIRVELNESFDWNQAYPDRLPRADPRWTDANGQPSILWEGALSVGQSASTVKLEPVGTGDLRGETGSLHPGLAGITTAEDIASSIEAAFEPTP